MTSFAVRSFGCRVNQAEAFGWVEALRRGGLRLEEDAARGDYLLVNSCTLTGRADRDVRRFIRRAARDNPEAKIVVTGCYAGRASEEFRRMPGVWLVVPNAGKDGLAARVIEAAGAGGPGEAKPGRRPSRTGRGPSSRCRTAVISTARTASSPPSAGRARASPGDEVVGRVRALVADGYREIVLAGHPPQLLWARPRAAKLAPRAPRAHRGGRRARARPPELARPAIRRRAARGASRGEPPHRAAFPSFAPERLGEDPAGDGQGVEPRVL